MRIGVVSDSHGYLYSLDKALQKMGDIDMIIHAGDGYKDLVKVNSKYQKRIECVRGNNDFSLEVPTENVISLEGVKIFLTHGDRYGVYFGIDRLCYKGMEEEANIIIYGHTHKQSLDYENGIWILNPGSTSLPRASAPGYAIMDIKDGDINIEMFTI